MNDFMNRAHFESLRKRYENHPEHLVQMLWEIQGDQAYIDPDVIDYLSASLKVPRVQVEATASFYSFLHLQPVGRLDLAKKMDSRYFCTVNPKEGVMSKRFSEQFKQEAVQLVSAERPIRQVASYLGIGYSTLDKWVRAHRERTGQLVALTQEQKRIRELERQVAHLQEVNDILKKATVYFANPANR